MKNIFKYSPGFLAGVILGASLITLSAASNDSAPEDLNVFFPGTEVSSADVNANFTYLDDEVTTLEGRMDSLENSAPSSEILYFQGDLNVGSGNHIDITVPQGYGYRIRGGHAVVDSNRIVSFSNNETATNISSTVKVVISGLTPSPFTEDVAKHVARTMNTASSGFFNWGVAEAPATIFPPGTNLYFEGSSNRNYTHGTVVIEKIPFSPAVMGD